MTRESALDKARALATEAHCRYCDPDAAHRTKCKRDIELDTNLIAAETMRARAFAYEEAVRDMRKNVYIYFGEDRYPGLLPGGAVPCWWLIKEAERIRAEADALERG